LHFHLCAVFVANAELQASFLVMLDPYITLRGLDWTGLPLTLCDIQIYLLTYLFTYICCTEISACWTWHRLLVGAPRDNGTSSWRLGMLYRCPLSSFTDDCSPIDVDWQDLIGDWQ